MVFNTAMTKHLATDADRQTIDRLGGPTKLAELLGYDKSKGGVQRIQNWKDRGIPSAVKLQRPDLFLPEFISTGGPSRIPAASSGGEEVKPVAQANQAA